MPIQPTPGDVHIDRALTDLSLRYSQGADVFTARKVFKPLPVQHRSDKYFVYQREQFFRTDVALRAPGSPTVGTGFGLTSADYSINVYGVHKDVDDQTRSNAESPINVDQDAVDLVTNQLLQYQENDFVSSFFTTGIWGTDSVGGTNFTVWSDATSTPVEDLRDAMVDMTRVTAKKPNTLLMGPEVWQQIVDHPDLLDRVKYTQGPAMASESLLAQILGIDSVHVAWAVKNTTAEGEAFTAATSMGFHFGKHAWLGYVDPSASGLNKVTAGITFTWSGLFGSNADGVRIKRFRMEELASDRIEGEYAYDMKVVASDLGHFFSGAVS